MPEHLLRGERMVRRKQRHHRRSCEEGFRLNVRMVSRMVEDAEIELAPTEAPNLFDRGKVSHSRLHRRVVLLQRGEEAKQSLERKVVDATDAEIYCESTRPPRLGDGEIEAGKNPTRLLGEDASCFSWIYNPARALEELDAKVVFELANRLRQRRLCHMQGFGRAPEMQFLEDGEEIPQVANLDAECGSAAAPGRGHGIVRVNAIQTCR
jgi:hypothetical protein